jgi:hypothetical protein
MGYWHRRSSAGGLLLVGSVTRAVMVAVPAGGSRSLLTSTPRVCIWSWNELDATSWSSGAGLRACSTAFGCASTSPSGDVGARDPTLRLPGSAAPVRLDSPVRPGQTWPKTPRY